MLSQLPFASGREADVYVVDNHRVLRRHRYGGKSEPEASFMTYLATRGFPVPQVFQAHGSDLVMERLEGPTMLSALLTGEVGLPECAVLLARLHQHLHSLPPMAAKHPEHRILHCDLHPDNIVLTARGPVVIDWTNVCEGDPDYDLALSAVILGETAVDEASLLAEPARQLLRAFLEQVGSAPLSALEPAIARRQRNPMLDPAEKQRLALVRTMVTEYCHLGAGAEVSENRTDSTPLAS